MTGVEQADDFYGEYYPGDSLSERAWQMVTAILAAGPLTPPARPDQIDLNPA